MNNIITGLATNITDITPGDYALAMTFVLLFMFFFFIVGVAVYLFNAFALYSIARKTDQEYSWFAFIPILNSYLWHLISRTSIWLFIIAVCFPIITRTLRTIPEASYIALLLLPIPMFINSIWYGNAAKRMNYSFWLGFSIPLLRGVSYLLLFIGSYMSTMTLEQTDASQEFAKSLGNSIMGAGLVIYIISMAILGIIAWKTRKQKTK